MNIQDIIDLLPSVLSPTEHKRGTIITAELNHEHSLDLEDSAVYLALSIATREGWAGKDRGGYIKIGAGRRFREEKREPSTFGVVWEVTA
jgi:hypothetical protein